jgi:rare lipoprotein A
MRVLLVVVIMTSVIPSAHALSSVVSGSYYHAKFEGRSMACGGRFDSDAWTAASNHHPCGSRLLVTYNDRDVVVQVTDRCGRCGIDLSRAAAQELGLLRIGRAPVRVERLAPERPDTPAPASDPLVPGTFSPEPVKSVWSTPSLPSEDGPTETSKTRPRTPSLRAGHVGAIPTAPIPSFWITRE